MPYRFELAKSARAGCQAKECKDEHVKIAKGELRIGSWVDTESRQFWSWRHWGCFTPKMIENMSESIKGEEGEGLNYEMLDGWEDLPKEHQEKVIQALSVGHIEDDEWRGDLECNRQGAKGMRLKGKAAKAAKEAKETKEKEGEEAQESSATGKKRGASEAEASDAAEKDEPAKKKRGPGRPKRAQSDEEATTEPKKNARAKKVDTDATVETQPKKRGRAPKKVIEPESEHNSDTEMPDAEEPKPTQKKSAGRPKADSSAKAKGDKTTEDDDSSKAGKKSSESANVGRPRGRKQATAKVADEATVKGNDQDDEPADKPKGKAAEAGEANNDQDNAPAAKPKGKRARQAKTKAIEEAAEAGDAGDTQTHENDAPTAKPKPKAKGNGRKKAASKDSAEPAIAAQAPTLAEGADASKTTGDEPFKDPVDAQGPVENTKTEAVPATEATEAN